MTATQHTSIEADRPADAAPTPRDPLRRRRAGSWRCCGSRFGLTFLWAFFDKLFALGFHTGYDPSGNARPLRSTPPGSTAAAPPRAS